MLTVLTREPPAAGVPPTAGFGVEGVFAGATDEDGELPPAIALLLLDDAGPLAEPDVPLPPDTDVELPLATDDELPLATDDELPLVDGVVDVPPETVEEVGPVAESVTWPPGETGAVTVTVTVPAGTG